MNKLFDKMTFSEKLAHIKQCQEEGLEEIRKGSPSNLADIADHLSLWGPWMLHELTMRHEAQYESLDRLDEEEVE